MKRVLVVILSALLLTSCSNSVVEQGQSEVSEYNKGVQTLDFMFEHDEKVARKYVDDIMYMVTCNLVTDESYALLDIPEEPSRYDSDTDMKYRFRSLYTIMQDGKTDMYNEYIDWYDGVSDWTNIRETNLYKYSQPYIIKQGYYSSVSSNYLCQFMVLTFVNCKDTFVVRAYWFDGKVHKIVVG